MRLYLRFGMDWKWFRNPVQGSSVVFGSYGRILGSAIERTSKSRYKVYVIATWGVIGGILEYGIGDALDCLQRFYDDEKPYA